MVLSREELRKQLQAALTGDAQPSKGKKESPAPTKKGNPFATKKRVVEVEEEEQEDEDEVAVAVAEDDGEVEDEAVHDEPESTPMDEVIDCVVKLIDCVMDHGEAIKSYLNNCR